VLPEGQLALEQIAAYFEKYFALLKGTWPDNTATYLVHISPEST
jgi:hypothetical protein